MVHLLTIMKNCLTQKNPKMCDPILVTLLKWDHIMVNPVVKMRPHPTAHPRYPLIRKYPPHPCKVL